MVEPRFMCTQHLCGEHVENHMILGTIKDGKSLDGYAKNNLLQLKDLVERHDILAEEMLRRGFNHKSPLLMDDFLQYLKQHIEKYHFVLENSNVDIQKSEEDLFGRCPKCREKRDKYFNSEIE